MTWIVTWLCGVDMEEEARCINDELVASGMSFQQYRRGNNDPSDRAAVRTITPKHLQHAELLVNLVLSATWNCSHSR